jgi:hypothetical protein
MYFCDWVFNYCLQNSSLKRNERLSPLLKSLTCSNYSTIVDFTTMLSSIIFYPAKTMPPKRLLTK